MRVGHIHSLQGCLLPHSNSNSSKEVAVFSHSRSILLVQSTSIWSVHSTQGVQGGSEGSQTDGITKGYKDLQDQDDWFAKNLLKIASNLCSVYTIFNSSVPGVRLDGKHRETRI